jgi:hypothetical protein
LSVRDVFEKLRAALEQAGIVYFVTGSFASSAHGIPRSTNDIDIVIAPTSEQLRVFLEQFPSSHFAKDNDDAFDALGRKSQFQVIDYATMWKVDLIIRQDTPFDAARFARREIIDIAGVRLQTASAEDILITKLWWSKLSDSERQLNDAVGIIKVQGANLDNEYVEHWVAALDLDLQWQAAVNRAG